MTKSESKYFNTAKRMNDALILLLEKKDFEYITVKDVCDAANVNRSTFYLHYQNTYDLLEETIFELNKSFSLHMGEDENFNSITNKKNLNELYLINDKYLIPYLNFIKENKKIYKAIKDRPELFKANKTYEFLFKNLFQPIMNRFGLNEKFHKYPMDFYINGITAIVFDWVDDDCKIDIIYLSHFIQGLIIKNESN